MESSESDGYEDVMSGDDEDAVVISQWTAGRKKTPTTALPNSAPATEVNHRLTLHCTSLGPF